MKTLYFVNSSTEWSSKSVSVFIFFEGRAIYVYFYKRKYFVKVNIDGSALKKMQPETN